MPIRFQTARSLPETVDALVMGVFSEQMAEGGGPPELDLGFLAAQGFKASVGEVRALPAVGSPNGRGGDRDGSAGQGGDGQGGAGAPTTVVAVGLGDRDAVTAATYRRAGAALAQAASRHRQVATTLLAHRPDSVEPADAARALAEGVVLGSYRFTTYKSDPAPAALDRVMVVDDGGRATTTGLDLGQAVAEAVCVARDLVNEPGGTLTPSVFAERAVNLGQQHGFSVRVRDERAIKRARLGGLLGVNRGSAEPPRFVELSWAPSRPRATVALVGKGVTFDSGGLSLKSTESMKTMKGDMAGAAAVLATFCALAATRPAVKVLGYLPLTDNMPGSSATRIGDVLHIRNGTTVEVLNTDAEGRLILADALVMASEARPDAIVDLATLTGTVVVALGDRTAGLMGNDEDLIDRVRAAADGAGEPVWPLPLPRHLRAKLDSDVADLKNVGGREGGALIAALFLREFVGEGIAWAHLDIAGPAQSGDNDGEVRKGGTGFGVRTLLRLLDEFPASRTSAPARAARSR